MKRYQFNVAALTFECQVPEGTDVQKFLFSFRPFQNHELSDEPVMVMQPMATVPDIKSMKLLESFSNDLGDVSVYEFDEGYAFSFAYTQMGDLHYMISDKSFSDVKYNIEWKSEYAELALTSMLRTAFSQCLLSYDGFMIHSSVVKKDNKGFLFLGKSGTGKSTHTRLWLKYIEGASLLNDDNPICRFIDDKLVVFGTPWSGKTPCYKNDSAEVASIVRLEQAPINEFSVRSGVLAWTEVFPSCSVLKESEDYYQKFVDILNRVVSVSIIGHLKCLPNQDAALVCEKNIRQLLKID